MNSPSAQVPLIWFLRCPACTPKVPSKPSIICEGVTSLVPAAAAPEANMGTLQIAVLAVRSANRALRWKADDFILRISVVDEWRILGSLGLQWGYASWTGVF
jgi:hypothetical protein